MIILQMVAESGLPVFRSSSAFQRGKLDIKENDKKSTRFDDNEGNIEMLLYTIISVNQLSILRNSEQIGSKTETKTHPKSQLPPVTDQNVQEHSMQKKY